MKRTGFLIGFKRQIKNMVDKERRITSAIFIGALLGTLFSAIVLQSPALVIICLVVQIPAYIWYCATYIPFARDCIKACLRGCLNKIKK
jgi:hypothetical protein